MSEDTDERMERAQRIRQMREGQRENAAADTDDGDGESEPSSPDDAAASSDTASDESSAASESAADAETETDQDVTEASGDARTDSGEAPSDEPGADDGPASTDDAADVGDPDQRPDPVDDSEPSSATAANANADPDPPSAADGGETASNDLDEEAAAAAERAAQAAASVSGDVSGGATDGEAVSAQATAGASPGAGSGESSGTTATAAPMQGPTGVELPDEESIQAAIADEVVDADDEPSEPATGRGAAAQEAATNEETVRVLEFTLGDEHYCLDIAHVEEIVKREAITRVPNTPDYVEGVVDLRGQITTILDPKLLLDIDQEGSESLLVVFAPEEFEDQGAIGWVVDEVRQVAPIAKSEVSDAPVDADYIEGVIDRDDEDDFVIWTDPEVAIRMATGEAESED